LSRFAIGAIAFGGLVAIASLVAADAPPRSGIAPAILSAADIGDRLRVFAKPGDYKLQNVSVTAVVRKKDGWLTELWRNGAVLPTAPQLGTITNIDGLWQLHPIVRLGDTNVVVSARRVTRLADAIEVDGVAEAVGARYRAVTRYRLHPSEPRLVMTTTFSVEGGAAAGGLGLGDAFKWGNVEYVVDGLKKPRMKFEGHARWIGRRGAGGDLILRARAPERMWIDYGARIRGFQGEITALYERKGIPAGGSVTVTRELGYEILPPVAEPAGPRGLLEVAINDGSGKPLPAKIRLDRLGHDAPLFAEDGDIHGADRFVWTGNGRARRDLPVGRYLVLVTAGIEREAHRANVFIGKGKTVRIDATLPRVVPTPGWIAADLHLHQAPSVDADISLENRVIAIAAEGVEFAVATDHYVVTDLAPTVKWLRERGILSVPVQTVVGSEVSTLGNRFGHFNVFPLRTDQNVVSDGTTPAKLFADARRKSPAGVLQVNHPRLGPNLGYFTRFGMDPDTGDVAVAGYSANFDTVEVYNGDEAYELKEVKKIFYDWIHLLGKGRRYAATGSSDSHKLAFLDPGLPRTLIRHGAGSDDASDVDAPASRVLDAIKRGHSIVTSGPIIEASIAGKGPGETVQGAGKRVKLRVVVRAAPWIDVRSVEVLMGGRGERVQWVEVPRSKQVLRLDRTFEISVPAKTFVIVAAQGQLGLANASRDKTQPFGFTNPIWIEP
jgi:hypothetical protein